MCSGRVDLEFIFRAFLSKVDGVFIGACHLGECNYITHGNYHAQNMVLLAKKIMEHIGLNPERLHMGFMSGGEGNLFTEIVDDFTKKMRELGPLGRSEGLDDHELKARLAEITRLVPYIKLEKRDKLEIRVEKDEYEDFYTAGEIDRLFSETAAYHIDPEKCQACMICLRRCPVDAIVGAKNQIHVIDQDKCIKCGTCFEACPSRFGAVQKIAGQPAPPPIPLEERAIVRPGKGA